METKSKRDAAVFGQARNCERRLPFRQAAAKPPSEEGVTKAAYGFPRCETPCSFVGIRQIIPCATKRRSG